MPLPIGTDSSHYAVVSAMITPAFFLTATSSLLATSNARLSRVVDRMRMDIVELKRSAAGAAQDDLRERVDLHRRRSRLVLAALRLLYGAVTAFVGTSMAIAAIGSKIGSELCFFFRWRVTIMTESPRRW